METYNREFDEIWSEIFELEILQKKEELFGLYKEIIKKEKRENVLEIGTLKGATALFFNRFFDNVYSIDNIKRYDGEKEFNFILGDTHLIGTLDKVHALKRKFDLIMIDGDHTYSGVRMDFENYCQFANDGCMIVFHDILISKWHINQHCEVGKYWNEIKDNFKHKEICYRGDLVEFNPYVKWINDLHPSQWGGIGILYWREKSGEVLL
jgi:cephalosporin hydroxylase